MGHGAYNSISPRQSTCPVLLKIVLTSAFTNSFGPRMCLAPMRLVLLLMLLLAGPCSWSWAQNPPAVQFPPLSPPSTLIQRVGLTDIEVVYSRPGLKGRQMFGAIHPYGDVWRTGANAATKITFSTPVKFGGVDVPAGSYGLFSIPEREEWTVILNSVWDQNGAYLYDKAKDVVRVKTQPIVLPYLVETFTIDFDELRDDSASLILTWERVRVPVRIEVDVISKVLPQIEALMATAGRKAPSAYFSSAQFYYDHGQDLNKALAWVNEGLAMNPESYTSLLLKAKILVKLGHTEEAIAAAKRSAQMAIDARDFGIVKQNTDLMSGLQ